VRQCLNSENVWVNFVSRLRLGMQCFVVECALVWVEICSFIVNVWCDFTRCSYCIAKERKLVDDKEMVWLVSTRD